MRDDLFTLHAEIELSHWWFVGRRRILKSVVETFVPPGAGHRIVEIGCGTGANVAALAADYDVCGIDPHEPAIALARRRFPNVHFIAGTAPADLRPQDRLAELFMLLDVIEHVPDDHAFMTDVLTAVPSGSRVLITVPADPALWSEHDESFGHYRRYTEETLVSLLASLPLDVEMLSYFNARLYPVVRAIRGAARVLGRASGRGGTDFSMPSAPVNRLLTRTFAGEARRLAQVRPGAERRRYRRGVSLIAVARKR
ncbi:MAG TPA: class I SAM-dependent methyltransferase [Longimicrobiales bacterium]|nr:class I SAM-dependent methyltransferase [Longimicrobiales bacterium]